MKENIQIWRLPHQNEVDFVRIENAKAALPPQVSDCYKLVFIERGARAFRCRKLRFTASAGDLLLIPPGETHEADAIPESPSVIRILQLPHEEIERFSPVDGRAFHFGTARFTPYVNDRSVVGAYRQVHLPASTFQSSLEVDSKLGELIRALIDSTGRDERSDRGTLHEAAAARRLKHYIEDNFADDLRLSDLARIAGLNPSYLCRSFCETVGMPPHAYQIALRVDKARVFLRQGLSVAEVANKVGFYDQSHLSRHFRRLVKISPARYAR